MTRFALPLAFVLAAAPAAAAHAQQKAVLLELFTSEGCSSCPPADAVLARLNNTHTHDGDLVVALSEHVTYWNSLGWRDPFSTETSTDRQRAYGERFRQDEVYTPQAVVNGEAQVLGSDQRSIQNAFATASQQRNSAALHITGVQKDGKSLHFGYTLSGPSSTKPLEIFAVVAEDMATSAVPRGENSGRTLTHVAVATQLTRVASGDNHGKPLELTLPPFPGTGPAPHRHLVLFAQTPGYGPVVAIDTVPL